MHVTIATAPCSWGVWYADGTPSGTPADLFLDQAAQAGYKALELGPDGYLPTDIGELREALSSRGLTACAGTACYKFDQYNSFEDFRAPIDALCKRLSAFDAKYLVTMDESDVGLYSEKKADISSKLWCKYFDMLLELGKYTRKEYGIETVFHPHIKTLIETEVEIVRLLSFSELNLCFDLGHHAYVNGGVLTPDVSTLDFMRHYHDKIKYLHFKNVDPVVRQRIRVEHIDADTAFDMDVMCDLKDGSISYEQVRRVLEEINFNGIGVIEQDLPRATNAQAFATAQRNLQYLRDIHIID